MKKILALSIALVLIPLLSYSQNTIQVNKLEINEKQLKAVLRDKFLLEYLKKDQLLSDSLLAEQEFRIRDLKEQIISYKIIDSERIVKINKWIELERKQRYKNRLIIVGSGIAVTGLVYLYIQK